MAKSKKRKLKQVAAPKSWLLEVLTTSHCHVTSEGDGERYGNRECTSTDWYVEGLKLVEKDGCHTVEVSFEPEKGKIYHLLYAVYSTGDSFGQDEGQCFEVIGIYKDRKVAEENEKRLLAPTVGKSWDDKFKAITLRTEGLGKHKYSRPWMGYFERLDRLEVESFILN